MADEHAPPPPPPGLAKWLRRGAAIGLIDVHPDDQIPGRVAYRLTARTSWKTAGPRKLAERVLVDAGRAQPDRFTVFHDEEGALWFVDETGVVSDADGDAG